MKPTIGRVVFAALLACVFVGCCEPLNGSKTSLGSVDYNKAFSEARRVMGTFYPVESADVDTGLITCRPEPTTDRSDVLLGVAPMRKLAKLRLTQERGEVKAEASVEVQKQSSATMRGMLPTSDKYSSVPDQTPADLEGATTAEQNEVWLTAHHARDIENKILQDLKASINPPKSE